MDEDPIMRQTMNLETVNSYESTEDIHRLIIGKDVTGFATFGGQGSWSGTAAVTG